MANAVMCSSRELKRRRVVPTLRRGGAVLFILAYLSGTGYYLGLHILGDTAFHPIGYLFTWDMFPSFYTQSTRKVAVARTAEGKYLQVHPGPYEQFRGGVARDMTRVDIERSTPFFEQAVAQTLRRTAAADRDDPVVHVYLFEQYWPYKFNRPASSPGETAQRRYWRLLKEYDVSEGALVRGKS
jgi:hypothetical protein